MSKFVSHFILPYVYNNFISEIHFYYPLKLTCMSISTRYIEVKNLIKNIKIKGSKKVEINFLT